MLPPPSGDPKAIAAAFLKPLEEFGERVRFISFTQVSNGNGMRIPDAAIDEIWNAVKARRHCHLHIDGAMSWGALPIDLSKPRCHSTTASAHKWFLGPKETGFLYMDSDRVEDFMPQSYAYDYKIVDPPWQNLGKTAMERFELLGQRDDVNLIHLASVQLMWNVIGFSRALGRIKTLADGLIERLVDDSGWELVTPEENRWAILRFKAGREPNARKPSLYLYLFDRGIASSGGGFNKDGTPSRGETVRLCPTIYNLESRLDAARDAMNDWRKLP